jgi:hypothetical protein
VLGKDPDKNRRNVKKRIKGVLGKDSDKKASNVKELLERGSDKEKGMSRRKPRVC